MSETDLKKLAGEFRHEYRNQSVNDIRKLFLEEAILRYSPCDDGSDRKLYRSRANEIFSNSAILEIDLHGYHPDDICGKPLMEIIEQAWRAGAERIKLIHGHGRGRGISPGFVNTNTGYFGLRLRSELRHNEELRQWIKHTTVDCSDFGATSIKMKPNRSPTNDKFDFSEILPESSIPDRQSSRWRW